MDLQKIPDEVVDLEVAKREGYELDGDFTPIKYKGVDLPEATFPDPYRPTKDPHYAYTIIFREKINVVWDEEKLVWRASKGDKAFEHHLKPFSAAMRVYLAS